MTCHYCGEGLIDVPGIPHVRKYDKVFCSNTCLLAHCNNSVPA